MKRRPNAADRDLANVWRKLDGKYKVVASNDWPQAPIKAEGGFDIWLEDKRIEVIPINDQGR